jgi:hypothetical protein
LRLHFGETILIQQRKNLAVHKVVNTAQPKSSFLHEKPKVRRLEQPALFEPPAPSANYKGNERKLTIDELSGEAIRSGFQAELIGKHLLTFSELPDGIEKAVAYSAIVVKARRARLMSSNSGQLSFTTKPIKEQS